LSGQIGIIGVGLLGSAVTRRWLQAGYRVVAFDRDTEAVKNVQAAGAEGAQSADEVWRQCRRVALVLPPSGVSKSVVADSRPRERALVMDMTTGDPDEMSRLAAEYKERGIAYLDTTVGGSSAQVLSGDSIVMIGGDERGFEDGRELLASFARKLFYLGVPGNGARMKLVMDVVLGLNRAVFAEGLGFAEACGLDPRQCRHVSGAGGAAEMRQQESGLDHRKGNAAVKPTPRLALIWNVLARNGVSGR
jgi:3-hydroxyisobutyrate dehydrogenase-like beta-hydroxyacid dehydrogenase